jgi:hypothetical protein
MFISQNSMLGRVQICLHLLKQGFVKNHPIQYFEKLISKYPGSLGNFKYSYLAFATSLVPSRIISLDLLLKVVYNKDFRKKRYNRQWLEDINLDQIKKLIVLYTKKEEINLKFPDSFIEKFNRELL